MAGTKLTPRQRLVNMMYLVFLALLALNIDVNFIDTFQDLNTSIQNANKQFTEERNQKLLKIQEAQAIDSLLFSPFKEKAQNIITLIDSSINYINDLEQRILKEGDGYNEYGYPANATNSIIPSRILLGDNASDTLYSLLKNTVLKLEKIIDPEEQNLVQNVIMIDQEITNFFGKKVSWESYHFNNVAQGAVLTTLNRFKNNLLLIESQLLAAYENKVFNMLTAGLSSFDVSDSLWMDINVMNAQQFRIGDHIYIVPNLPQIEDKSATSITTTIRDENGMLVQKDVSSDDGYILSYLSSNPGTFSVTTDITQNGKSIYQAERELRIVEQEIIVNYIVNELIKLDGYSSLFLGVKNPVIIEHPAYSLDELKLKIDNGSMVKYKNSLAVIPERLGLCTVELFAPDDEQLSSASFMVKNLPAPYPFINNEYQSQVSAKIFRVLTGISAGIEGFEWNDSYTITSFNTRKLDGSGKQIVNNKSFGTYFDNSTLKQVRNARKGDTFIFDDIQVSSSDGRNRVITGLVVKII